MNKKPTLIKSSEQESFSYVDPAYGKLKVDPEQSFSPINPENPLPKVDNSPNVYPNEALGIPTPSDEAARIASMPDEWKIRNGYPVDPLLADVVLEDIVNVPEPPVIPVQLNPVVLPTDVPLVNFSALREVPLSAAKVGIPVVFAGEYAAIITKVWDNGFVNLIVFSAEHPVSDIKTKVPYGEGFNTWKEIN